MTKRSEDSERGFTLEDPPQNGAGRDSLPRVDFSTFVLSLATSALYHMGLGPDPSGEKTPEKNLPLARQTIDTIEMLEEKTRGNLDEQEAQLLESVLYELRMDFVRAGR